MDSKLVDWLICPRCRADFDVVAGKLICTRGHEYSIDGGLPRLMAAADDPGEDIHHSFSREWSHFEYDEDRTWGQTTDERREITLMELDSTPEEIAGKLVLDAGCGTGVVSRELSRLGGEVVAADISDSVRAAHVYFQDKDERIHFLQADMTAPPFRPGTFDIVFSGGVLHHNPDTRQALGSLAPLVAPGGSIYVWLYWKVPGLRYTITSAIRRVVAPLPAPIKHTFVRVWLVQSMLRKQLRKLAGRSRPEDELSWREKLVILLDHYTPRYRWEHTPDELAHWCRELGFVDIKTTNEGKWGFGVLAHKSPVPAAEKDGRVVQPA